MTHHMTAVMEQTIRDLLDALEPFAVVVPNIREKWKRDVPLKHQLGIGAMPTVRQYETLAAKARNLRALVGE